MEHVTDYLKLWRELVEARYRGRPNHDKCKEDVWKNRARGYEEGVRKRWEKSDSSREWMLGLLRKNPGSTFLDIGAGTGAWTRLVAPHCSHVTAVEPSDSMIEVLKQSVADAELANIDIIRAEWPFDPGQMYDITLSSHSIYGAADFRAYIEAMIRVTRTMCVLLLRAPVPNGLMAEISMKVWGQPHDSANFQIAYNALLQMGIFADVIMENSDLWQPWSNDSIEDAVQDVKRKMGLMDTGCHDDCLRDILSRNLTRSDGRYVWPPGNRSALVYWEHSSRVR